MEKSFLELYELDLTSYIKKKPVSKAGSVDYLEWATVLVLLYQNGATEVSFHCKMNQYGYPAFFNEGKTPFVHVFVKIDEDEYQMHYPVISGFTAPAVPSQLQISNAIQRGFVKCVAINTGLGLSLWQKDEELSGQVEKKVLDDFGKSRELGDKLQAAYAKLLGIYQTSDAVNDKLGVNNVMIQNLLGSGTLQAKQDQLDQMNALIKAGKQA